MVISKNNPPGEFVRVNWLDKKQTVAKSVTTRFSQLQKGGKDTIKDIPTGDIIRIMPLPPKWKRNLGKAINNFFKRKLPNNATA